MKAEVYEDNAGELYIFALKQDAPVWGATYYEDSSDGMTGPEMCAADYVGLTMQGLDPLAEGWDGVDSPIALYDAMRDCRTIASSDDTWREQGVWLDGCGIAGRQFAAALGIDCEV